jgi:hypothetical protein
VKDGGWGLIAASHINKVQPISNVVNNSWNSEAKYPGELIKTRWIKKTESDDPAASPMEIIISEAIAKLPAKLVMTEEESQKSEEKLTFVKTKREDRIWDRKKKKWTLPIWTDGGKRKRESIMHDGSGKEKEDTPELESNQSHV